MTRSATGASRRLGSCSVQVVRAAAAKAEVEGGAWRQLDLTSATIRFPHSGLGLDGHQPQRDWNLRALRAVQLLLDHADLATQLCLSSTRHPLQEIIGLLERG